MLYNEGIKVKDKWAEASRFFVKEKESKTEHMTLPKLYTGKVRAADRPVLHG